MTQSHRYPILREAWRTRNRTYEVKALVISLIFALHENALLHRVLEVVVQCRLCRDRNRGSLICGTHAEVEQEDEEDREKNDGSGRG